ncbi:MAG: DUF3592 domain-containing protein [Pirellula sp.]|jgi:hypothetical protein
MRMPTILVTSFFGMFFLIGFGIISFSLWNIRSSLVAGGWPTATGTIKAVHLDRKSDSDGDIFETKVVYNYVAQGKQFEGNRIAYGYCPSNGQRSHEQIFAKLQSAQTVEVRYDPSRPETSVLSYGIHRSHWFLLAFGTLWLAFSMGLASLIWIASLNETILLKNLNTQ